MPPAMGGDQGGWWRGLLQGEGEEIQSSWTRKIRDRACLRDVLLEGSKSRSRPRACLRLRRRFRLTHRQALMPSQFAMNPFHCPLEDTTGPGLCRPSRSAYLLERLLSKIVAFDNLTLSVREFRHGFAQESSELLVGNHVLGRHE